ncbi:helix-turn-helix domain-containing protein [uncultured Selenomonas sp.]|uniref:helix-turn-helix domain-containing protein n=1 Tax=uncultured Selenomonas sp. TaxID=159275 RepID=UPI0025E4EAC6|nr:helix-turn-helix transcriptional regulator [uncultured Selenomonas sp.]
MSTDMGRKIRELREKCGLTQREVANAVGVTEATVSRWESGHINNMRRDKIQSLAKILQVSPLVIMGMKEQDPPAAPPSAQEGAEPYKAPLTKRGELTEHEREHIELYRELDERGRNAVDDLTDLHVERVRESTERSSSSTGTEIADEKQA